MKKWLLIGLLVPPFFAKAQVNFNSFEQLLQYADKQAVSIRSGWMGEQLARSEVRAASANRLPSIGATLGYIDNITLQPALVPAQFFNPTAAEGELQELTFGTKYQYSGGVQAAWDVVNFQKKFAVHTAKISVEEAQLLTEVNRYNTYHQLANTYYSILLTQESIQIYEENLKVSDQLLEHTKEKYEDGVCAIFDVNQIEIKHRQNQLVLDRTKNNLSQLYLQLQSQLNTTENITISDQPEKFVLESRAINNPHPEVQYQEKKLEVYQSNLKQQKASRLPTVSLLYQNNIIYATDDFMNFGSAIDQPQQLFGVQINFSNLFNFSTAQRIEQSQKQIELQNLLLESTQVAKNYEDQRMQLQWDEAVIQLNENRKILALEEENDVHAANRYEEGITSLDQRLNQYTNVLLAQDKYLQSLAEFALIQYQIFIRQHNF